MLTMKFLDIPPLGGVAGTVRAAGLEEHLQPRPAAAGLAAGTTTSHGLLDSDDTRVMIDALARARLRRRGRRRSASPCTAWAAAALKQRDASSSATPARRCAP